MKPMYTPIKDLEFIARSIDAFAYMVGMLMAMQSIQSAGAVIDLRNLVREAVLGNADNVQAIVSRYPGQV